MELNFEGLKMQTWNESKPDLWYANKYFVQTVTVLLSTAENPKNEHFRHLNDDNSGSKHDK